jgi:hypothetical protein
MSTEASHFSERAFPQRLSVRHHYVKNGFLRGHFWFAGFRHFHSLLGVGRIAPLGIRIYGFQENFCELQPMLVGTFCGNRL